MAITYSDGLLHPASRKLVFAQYTFRRQMWAWVADSGVHYDTNIVAPLLPSAMNENDAEATEVASLAALQAQDTSVVGAWWWNATNERLYVKPKAGNTAYEQLWIASLRLLISRHGGELDDEPYDARISVAPSTSLQTAPIFDGAVARIGVGAIQENNVDALIQRARLQPDGQVQLIEQLEVFA